MVVDELTIDDGRAVLAEASARPIESMASQALAGLVSAAVKTASNIDPY
jgi:hypothetical protein